MNKKGFSIIALLYTLGLSAQTTNELDTTQYIGLKEASVFASFSNQQQSSPVVLSTVGQKEINSRISNTEFPEVMKFSPSLYVSRKGGGFGDSRLTLRGFTNENLALTINGIPVNGVENGSVYWSNWSGLADIAAAVQVQRGIGLSGRAVSSVGGTVNILTGRTESQKGGSLYYTTGNDGYEKIGIKLSTGQVDGWAFTFAGSRTRSDGYVKGTDFESWSYFGELSKRIGNKHTLFLTAFGAPQWHNGNGRKNKIATYQNSSDGIRHNADYGILNGEVRSTLNHAYNKYHKPQISLSHYWMIDDKSSLTSSLYASLATGGGQLCYGLGSYKNADGTTDFNAAINGNAGGGSAKAYLTMSTNDHDWYGLLSNYNRSLSDELKLTVGIDARLYKGYHYEELSDLLGASYLTPSSPLGYQTTETQLHTGDKLNYDYVSRIAQYGAFAEIEYTKERYNAFASFALNNNSLQREDYSAGEKTAKKYYIPTTSKVGFNLYIDNDKHHRVFINGGYMTRAPKLDNIYNNNELSKNPIMEKALSGEIGYGIQLDKFYATLNAYYIRWKDKSTTTFLDESKVEKACIPNIDAIHKGIELEMVYMPVSSLKLKGYASVGSWKWANDVTYQKYDYATNLLGEGHAYINGLHVGDAPQTSMGANAEWSIMKNFILSAEFNYYARHYANFYPDARTNKDDRADSWKLPDYGIVDLRAAYSFNIGASKAKLMANVNNLFNKEYISDAQDGASHSRENATVWYGFGRTWTVSLNVAF